MVKIRNDNDIFRLISTRKGDFQGVLYEVIKSPYFGHAQNYLEIEGNLRIVVYEEEKIKEIKINHKGKIKNVQGCRRLTRTTNEELDKNLLNFGRCANRHVPPLSEWTKLVQRIEPLIFDFISSRYNEYPCLKHETPLYTKTR